MKSKQYPSENFITELKSVYNKITFESTKKGRSKHPLYQQWIEEIIKFHDFVFPNLANKPISQKVSGIFKELNRLYDKDEMTCQCCGVYRRHDLKLHIKNHGMKLSEYKDKFGEKSTMSAPLRMKYADRISGEKNPAYQHGGKFSSLSKNFVRYSELSEEEKQNKINVTSCNISRALKESINLTNKKEYYTSRGYTEKEAEVLLKDRQSTFSLEKLILKYGKEEGERRWKERQDKWQKTLKSKSPEEILRINGDKSKGRMSQLFSNNPAAKNYPGFLYYVQFYDCDSNQPLFYKIGITSLKNGAKGRLSRVGKNNLRIEILLQKDDITFYEAYKLEQKILKINKDKRITVNHNGFKSTECFSEDITESINKILCC
jgi:hypothetical protein